MNKKFTKNDNSFICQHCGANVPALTSSSRDHCNQCLHSLHVDINPGDRANTCHGLLIPQEISLSNKKGYVITYKCEKCGQTHNNKAAEDDSFETILSIMKNRK